MKIVETWCESTKEGMSYLRHNGYDPICRLSEKLWLVKRIGNFLSDVKIIE